MEKVDVLLCCFFFFFLRQENNSLLIDNKDLKQRGKADKAGEKAKNC